MKKHAYHLRPGYGSENLLIEFINYSDGDTLNTDFLDALKELNPEVKSLNDLWVNDELIYTIDSNLGSFTFSIDTWGFAFIIADDNQLCITRIAELLLSDNRFHKIEVDPAKYH